MAGVTDLISRLVDPILLPEHEIAVGLTFVQGAGYRVGTVTPAGLNHMSAAQARRVARELDGGAHGGDLSAATAAMRSIADMLDRLETLGGADLASMPVQGQA